jgi:glycosyltransferase involved in cell wall biosynthesis
MMEPRIGVVVVAYNAEGFLAKTLGRISSSTWDQLAGVIVLDDASADGTFDEALRFMESIGGNGIEVFRNPANMGYGGNQKIGYEKALSLGWDIICLLHGDGQYAPEYLEAIWEPIVHGRADMVLGSRMLPPFKPIKGGMPIYKYVGNKVLTRLQNALLHTHLSEFHSGYRAYRSEALIQCGYEQLSDGFNFDTQIIISMLDRGFSIEEVPVPTFYGDEVCYVNGLSYAKEIMRDTLRYRLRGRIRAGDP